MEVTVSNPWLRTYSLHCDHHTCCPFPIRVMPLLLCVSVLELMLGMVVPLELPHLFCVICLHGSVLSSVVSVMPCLGLQWNTLHLSTTHGPHCDRCAVLQMDVTCRLVPCAIDTHSAHFSISHCSSHTLMITYGCVGANRHSECVVSRLPVENV